MKSHTVKRKKSHLLLDEVQRAVGPGVGGSERPHSAQLRTEGLDGDVLRVDLTPHVLGVRAV